MHLGCLMCFGEVKLMSVSISVINQVSVSYGF